MITISHTGKVRILNIERPEESIRGFTATGTTQSTTMLVANLHLAAPEWQYDQTRSTARQLCHCDRVSISG